MRMAEIFQFPNPLSNSATNAHDLQTAAGPSGGSDMDNMLQARARIQKVLHELDRLTGELCQLVIEG
ncbi:hypothetical protein AMC90_PD00638 (plasmid) [Rhizobium phaseoli]|uniref:Uncharacterized protein n=2 Tax=Rhizobium phaseoli TaxID=396 RepID=A0ABN4QTX3_9HYPH|nr:hypothetical protein [Rhizobium phaseoli]KEC69914.1 hypothetical protein RLPCCGM1_p1433 [Rhizobium leguminosarum bv. phaseoli CCGM1]ANL31663.1 hypothetical protein AMC90_PD00638 [Rhizobium phaseoli]ANL57111.1 hypothetical protein AMC86_PD00652 [Rhizobium phaseoli]ANL88885.1 hypothetical protein AMC81_PE00640 [Rhizobium phaseoli]ANL95394.1 hypothetical protein AMC80_PE00640 [Rhizobium phaseoli]